MACETLQDAAAFILSMPMSQFKEYEPETTAEASAVTLAKKVLRGDSHAFHELISAADRSAVIELIEDNADALTKSLQELAATL